MSEETERKIWEIRHEFWSSGYMKSRSEIREHVCLVEEIKEDSRAREATGDE